MTEKLGEGSDSIREQDSLSPSFGLWPTLKTGSKLCIACFSNSLKNSLQSLRKHLLSKLVISGLMFVMNGRRLEMQEEFMEWELEGVQERKRKLMQKIRKKRPKERRMSWHNHSLQQ